MCNQHEVMLKICSKSAYILGCGFFPHRISRSISTKHKTFHNIWSQFKDGTLLVPNEGNRVQVLFSFLSLSQTKSILKGVAKFPCSLYFSISSYGPMWEKLPQTNISHKVSGICRWMFVYYKSLWVLQAGHDPTGYHIKRQEFDHEYDNDAEMLISEISFNPGDTPVSHPPLMNVSASSFDIQGGSLIANSNVCQRKADSVMVHCEMRQIWSMTDIWHNLQSPKGNLQYFKVQHSFGFNHFSSSGKDELLRTKIGKAALWVQQSFTKYSYHWHSFA